MRLISIIAFLALALYAGNAEAVDFKLGEFNIAVDPPATVEELKSTPIPGYYDSLSGIEMDGKPAVMILANKFTTVEYVKDDKTLITLQFKKAEGTDSSNSIAATIESFKATRA